MDERESTNKQPSFNSFPYKGTINELLTLLVAVASLVVSWFTYQNAADNTDIRNAVAQLTDLAKDAKRAADAGVEQAAALREGLRPVVYLRLTDVPIPLSNNRLSVRRRLFNSGRGSALNVARHSANAVFEANRIPGDGLNLDYPTSADFDDAQLIGFIAPGTEPGDASSNMPDVIGMKEQDGILSGTLVWVEWGGVRYEDVFGRAHHTWFCHTWDARSPRVANCPKSPRND